MQGNPLDERAKLVTLTVNGSEAVRLMNGALFDIARRIVANEDDTGAKEVKRRHRFLTNRKRAKAELTSRLIKTTAAPVQRRTKPLSTR